MRTLKQGAVMHRRPIAFVLQVAIVIFIQNPFHSSAQSLSLEQERVLNALALGLALPHVCNTYQLNQDAIDGALGSVGLRRSDVFDKFGVLHDKFALQFMSAQKRVGLGSSPCIEVNRLFGAKGEMIPNLLVAR